MALKLIKRLLGLVIFVAATAYINYEWKAVLLHGGTFSPKLSGATPLFAACGLILLICPVDKRECIAKFGVEKPQRWAHLTPGQKTLMILGAVAGFLNILILSGDIKVF